MILRHWTVLLLVALLASCARTNNNASTFGAGCGGSSSAAQRNILNGSTDDQCRFSSVIPIEIQTANGDSALCSGTVISTTAVLTAGHCVKDPELGTIRSIVVVGPNGAVAVRDARVHPGFKLTSESAGVDIAVLILSRPLSGVSPVKLSQGIPSAGTTATAVGFGEDGRGSDGRGGIGTRLVGSMRIDKYVPYSTPLPSGERRSGITTSAADQRGNEACQGDSGGPLFAGGEQVAVLSGGEYRSGDDRCVYAVNSVYTPVAPFLSWIQQQL